MARALSDRHRPVRKHHLPCPRLRYEGRDRQATAAAGASLGMPFSTVCHRQHAPGYVLCQATAGVMRHRPPVPGLASNRPPSDISN